MSVIHGCYMNSVNDNLQFNDSVALRARVCVCVCVCVCVLYLWEWWKKGDYNSWRVTEDGGKKL